MAEETFVKPFLTTLASQPIQYADDYQQPPENWLRKVPVLPAIPPPPQRIDAGSSSSASAISVTFKCPKPVASYTITVQPTDTIGTIKSQLASVDSGPPADVQRLLFKGKALADGKLLKDYSIKDGDTINLMVKPGVDWDPASSGPTKQQPTSAPPPPPQTATTIHAPAPMKPETTTLPVKRPALETEDSSTSLGNTGKPSRKHQRIPSVVLSPSPSSETTVFGDKQPPMDIMLTLDTPAPLIPSSEDYTSSYHAKLAQPEFWDRLNHFIRSEFSSDADALLVFEDFLRASKGALTVSDIAKIRDHVGVIGMAGT